MSEQVPLIPVEKVIHDPPVKPLCAWVVVAYSSRRSWKLFPSLYLDPGAAEAAAKRLPVGWTHRTVLRIELPGER